MTLYPHQQRVVDEVLPHLPGGWALLPEQRVGKSRIALELARRMEARRILVLCPSQHGNVPKVWVDEAKAHWPEMRVVNLTGTGRERAEALGRLSDAPAIVVCNYEAAWRTPLCNSFLALPWDVLICDEIHRLKSHVGAQHKAVVRIADRTPVRLGLTGTPMHSPLDVWGEMRIVDPTVFGTSFVKFRLRYSRPASTHEYRDRDIIFTKGYGGALQRWKLRDLDDLQARLYSRATRVTLAEAFPDLPPVLPDEVRTVALEPAARKAYRDLTNDMVTEVREGMITASNAAVKVLRLQQLCGGTLRTLDGTEVCISTAKEDLLAEMLEDLQDEPLVIFGRFHSDLDAIHRAVLRAGLTAGELSGRRSDLDEWKAGAWPVLVVQVQAGGVGIDLTRSSTVIWYSTGTSLIDWDQAHSRVLGPKQTRPVVNYVLLAEDTERGGDEAVYAALSARQDVVRSVVDGLRVDSRRI